MTEETALNVLLFITGAGLGLIAGLTYCVEILKESNRRLRDSLTELRMRYIELKFKEWDEEEE